MRGRSRSGAQLHFDSIVKLCACGRRFTRREWDSLSFVGHVGKGIEIAGEVLELRRCGCGSAIAIDLGDEPDSLPAIRIHASA